MQPRAEFKTTAQSPRVEDYRRKYFQPIGEEMNKVLASIEPLRRLLKEEKTTNLKDIQGAYDKLSDLAYLYHDVINPRNAVLDTGTNLAWTVRGYSGELEQARCEFFRAYETIIDQDTRRPKARANFAETLELFEVQVKMATVRKKNKDLLDYAETNKLLNNANWSDDFSTLYCQPCDQVVAEEQKKVLDKIASLRALITAKADKKQIFAAYRELSYNYVYPYYKVVNQSDQYIQCEMPYLIGEINTYCGDLEKARTAFDYGHGTHETLAAALNVFETQVKTAAIVRYRLTSQEALKAFKGPEKSCTIM